MNVRTFDLVKGMTMRTLLATITMAPAAVIDASNTEPAKLLAVFVVDTEDNALTTPDHAGGSR